MDFGGHQSYARNLKMGGGGVERLLLRFYEKSHHMTRSSNVLKKTHSKSVGMALIELLTPVHVIFLFQNVNSHMNVTFSLIKTLAPT